MRCPSAAGVSATARAAARKFSSRAASTKHRSDSKVGGDDMNAAAGLVLRSGEDRRAQGGETLGAAREQIIGIAAVLQDAAVDLDALVGVHAEARQELQAQVIVAVDLGVLQPGAQLRSAAAVGRQQRQPRIEAGLTQRA